MGYKPTEIENKVSRLMYDYKKEYYEYVKNPIACIQDVAEFPEISKIQVEKVLIKKEEAKFLIVDRETFYELRESQYFRPCYDQIDIKTGDTYNGLMIAVVDIPGKIKFMEIK